MTKVLVEIYSTYGKQDGRELWESYVSEDSQEMREDLYERWARHSAYVEGDRDEFVQGDIDEVLTGEDGGDWDDPTGYEIAISSYEQKKAEIEDQYQRDLARLNRQFEMEDK